jgi:hypothetical protein
MQWFVQRGGGEFHSCLVFLCGLVHGVHPEAHKMITIGAILRLYASVSVFRDVGDQDRLHLLQHAIAHDKVRIYAELSATSGFSYCYFGDDSFLVSCMTEWNAREILLEWFRNKDALLGKLESAHNASQIPIACSSIFVIFIDAIARNRARSFCDFLVKVNPLWFSTLCKSRLQLPSIIRNQDWAYFPLDSWMREVAPDDICRIQHPSRRTYAFINWLFDMELYPAKFPVF